MQKSKEPMVLKKAIKLLKEGRVKLDYKNGNKWYFSVMGYHDTYSVIINEHTMSCTCKYESYHPNGICSHKLAALLYILRQE